MYRYSSSVVLFTLVVMTPFDVVCLNLKCYKKCIHSHYLSQVFLIILRFHKKITSYSMKFPVIPSNSQISQKNPSDSKKLFGISWNVLDFSV